MRALVVSHAAALTQRSVRPRFLLRSTMASWSEATTAAPADTAIGDNLRAVQERVAGKSTLIAVSKLKPLSAVAAAFEAGQRDFGENYVQELAEKGEQAKDVDGIRWHFIGSLQSNKVKLLCNTPNLACVHTVDRAKIAKALDRNWGELGKPAPLPVFVQVNTSGEESKGGCAPADAPALAQAVAELPNLELAGLMCIGKYSGAEGDASPDFRALAAARDAAAAALGVEAASLGLSMGMSHDYEQAIEHGATHVRVGSTIFGARPTGPAAAPAASLKA